MRPIPAVPPGCAAVSIIYQHNQFPYAVYHDGSGGILAESWLVNDERMRTSMQTRDRNPYRVEFEHNVLFAWHFRTKGVSWGEWMRYAAQRRRGEQTCG